MRPLDSLPRVWWAFDLPGYRESRESFATYSASEFERLPPITRNLDPELRWLRAESPVQESLAHSPRSPDPVRLATREQLALLVGDRHISLPRSFRTFIADSEPRKRVRSCTACYLDLGDFVVDVTREGWLIHFLSDQQWVLHWLLFVGTDGSEAVLVTESPLGFEDERASTSVDEATLDGGVCASSFSEFLYRFWIENEIWFRVVEPDGDEPPESPLSDEQRAYAAHYVN